MNGQNTYDYVFQYKDQVGNIRMSYAKDPQTGDLKILEEHHYYPFGFKHKNYANIEYKIDGINNNTDKAVVGIDPGNPPQLATSYKYRFQGQERQEDLSLNWDSFKWRNYDYAIGRFMSIDPLSEKYTYNSPYAFSENSVVGFWELEGLEKISVHTASFAPFEFFGGPYHSMPIGVRGPFIGDGSDRTAGVNPNASSRVYGRQDLDLSGKSTKEIKMSSPYARGSESHSLETGMSTYSEATLSSTISKYADKITLDMHLSANNDLVPGSPDIDVKPSLSFKVVQENGTKIIKITGNVTGDGFPANETYITDINGKGILLGSSDANRGPYWGPLLSLPGNGDEDMSSFNLQIKLNDDDSFNSVIYGEYEHIIP